MKEGMPQGEELSPIESALQKINASPLVRLYNRDGHYVFSGSKEEFASLWQHGALGTPEQVGGITDEKGNTLVRFAPNEREGFLSYESIPHIFSAVAGTPQETQEQHTDVMLRETALGFEGEIIIDGMNVGDVSLWKTTEETYYIHNIQI